MARTGRKYGVKIVRGPFVRIPKHREGVPSAEDLEGWLCSRNDEKPLAVDLFCGAGGLSVGLTDAGFDVAVGVDIDETALETYAGLHPGLTLKRDLADPQAIDEVAGVIDAAGVDLIAGGPPCQPFSKAGASKIRSLVESGVRPEHDERRDLWAAFLELVLRCQPRAVLMENVPDMAIGADTSIVRTIVTELEADGYAVHTAILHASEHGIPQFRQRLFLVALADGRAFDWPAPVEELVTVGQAIGDFPAVEGGWRPEGGAAGFLPYEPPDKPTDFVRRARKSLRGHAARRIYDHVTRPVREDDRVIFDSMDPSTRYSDIDDSLKRYRDDIFDDKYKRLDFDQPSRSITAHIARDGYWYIHPEQPRTLTVREAARLQTFPDRVRFAGPPSAAFRQIGNAVPPVLGERVGKAIRHSFRNACSQKLRTIEVADRMVEWFEQRASLALPWLDAPTTWSALAGQILLGRARSDAMSAAWSTMEKLDSPRRTIEHRDQLIAAAGTSGRVNRVDSVLEAAAWFEDHPDALTTTAGMQKAPHVGPHIAEVAALTDLSIEPMPTIVNSGTLRVAGRVLGLDVAGRRSRSDGRLAVARLIGGSRHQIRDESRMAMAGVLELSASLCRPSHPACDECPLSGICRAAEGGKDDEEASTSNLGDD